MRQNQRMRYYPAVGPAIPRVSAGRSRVTHPSAGDPLLGPRDLHVLSTPPAFVLSQDQTLQGEKLDMLYRTRPSDMTSEVTSGITSCWLSLPAAHENGRSTRAIARITHSIVKQHVSVPKCSWGTGEFSR